MTIANTDSVLRCNVAKTLLNHPPNHSFYRSYGYHSRMGGLWHGSDSVLPTFDSYDWM